MDETPPKGRRNFWMVYLLFAIPTLILVDQCNRRGPHSPAISYAELVEHIEADRVLRVELHETSLIAELKAELVPELADEGRAVVRVDRLPNIDEAFLLEMLRARGVDYAGRPEVTSLWTSAAVWLLLSAAFMFLLLWLVAGRMRKMGGPMSIGKADAKLYDRSKDNPVTFRDVAGVDEARAELMEVVDFLQRPERYVRLGAQIPKGVLLVGPPGTGKTLLARAVAGEAEVPFFSMSGASFVEMFVGVGAARIRNLFSEATKRAPCIVFIDEIDAVGRTRAGARALGGHEEREQTLDQLLHEMDGFQPNAGVVIVAATNRPEVLDPALLRAGRFDRQVLVDRPDLEGRIAILEVHARRLVLADEADLTVVARRVPGMVGADLANVINEAALAAARRAGSEVTAADFEEAIDRIQLGLKKQSRVMSEGEKRRVAFHEAGHALVAMSVEHADPVHRVSIIPRSIGALGVTLQLPTQERYLMTRAELRDRLCVMLGGRAAEALACSDISTGAEDDLERATEVARQMVTRFGMDEGLGPVSLSGRDSPFLDGGLSFGGSRLSEQTNQKVDEAIRRLLDQAHERASAMLSRRHRTLDDIAERLLAHETLQTDELDALVARHPPGPTVLSPTRRASGT